MNPLKRVSLMDYFESLEHREDNINYLNNYTYIGAHNSTDEIENECARLIHSVVMANNIDGQEFEEKITGLLLVYPQYFIHFLECSEFSIKQHFNHLNLLRDEKKDVLIDVKLLGATHNVYRRMYNMWMYTNISPEDCKNAPAVNVEPKFENSHLYSSNLCLQYFQLAFHLNDFWPNHHGKISEQAVQDTLIKYLPNLNKIKFLMGSDYFPDLEHIIKLFKKEPLEKTNIVWPTPDQLYPKSIEEGSENN